MIFHGRGRSTTSTNGSNKSQASTTSSGKSREHQGGVSLREDTEDTGHHGGASLVDNNDHEGGASLRNSDNEAAKENKQGGVKFSTTNNNSVEASSPSVGASSRFSQRQKATSISSHNMENVQSKHAPAKPYDFKNSMAPRAYNNFNKGVDYRGPFAGHYTSAQQQPTRLIQSSSAPALPYVASPLQSSMGNLGMPPRAVNGSFYAPMPPATMGPMMHHPRMPAGVPPPTPLGTPYSPVNTVVPAPQMGDTPSTQFAQPGNAHVTPYGNPASYHNAGNAYVHNSAVPSPTSFSHVTPQGNMSAYGSVDYNSNVRPVTGSNGSHGYVAHGNYQVGHSNGVMTAQSNYVVHNNNVVTPHVNSHVVVNNSIGTSHGSQVVHNSGVGMIIQNNAAGAPAPSHAGKQLKYFINPHTGDRMTLDGTIWTPHGEKKDIFSDSSVYNQTEPRNFAPRPMGSPIVFPPPLPFNLHGGANNQITDIVSSTSITDPFSSPSSSAINAVNRAAISQADSQELACREPTEGNEQLSSEWGLLRDKLSTLRKFGSDGLQNLIRGYNGIPSESVLLSPSNFPFIESSSQSMPATWGVVKISNIPFATLRSEILAFLGRNSKILNDAQEGVHIIMERVTSKTGDAYVEFVNQAAANRAIDRHNEAIRKHRHPRLGDRPVDMTISSQKELMAVLFPWCRGVKWNHGRVEMLPFDEENPWNVFRGFVTEEEMNLMIKHVEVPSRSPYSKDCPQRPYESMISTLKKLPWYRSDVITLKQRQVIFDAICRLIEILGDIIQRADRPANNQNVLNEQLFKRLINAAMLCPGFSVLQKDNIAYIAGLTGPRITQFNMPPFADCWTHLYNLCPRPGVPVDVLEWYIALVREETVRFVGTFPESEQAAIKERAKGDHMYFGHMWYEIRLPKGEELAAMTLREVAKKELEAIKRALRRAAAIAQNPWAIEGASQHRDHPQVI